MIGPIRNFPGLRVAMSEGGTGWVPFYLDRLDRHYKNQVWRRLDFGGKLPSEVFKEHFLTCFITDPSALKLRYDIGVDTIAWELDYPHSDSTWPEAPEFLWAELQHAGVVDREEIDMITWKNAARFFRWDPFQSIPKDEANVGALRKHATNVDTTLRTRAEYVEENTKAGRTLEVFAGRA
jgi:predicted TIM-barrel fold metal-dependent hydrolase